MKKYLCIFIFIFIIFVLSSNKIYANNETELIEEPIVCEINSSNFSDYDMNNMASFAGNIKNDTLGIYDIFYTDYSGKNYRRNVLILDRNTMNKGLAYIYPYDYIEKNAQIGLNGDILEKDMQTYKYINELDNSLQQYCHIYFEDQNESHTMAYAGINIKKIINIDNQGYVLYEYIESETKYSKIGVMIIDKNCIMLRNFIYQTNKSESAIDLIYLNNKLYVIFNTQSNTGICTRAQSFLSAAIMEINKTSLNPEKINFISNDNDAYVEKVNIYNDKIYLEMMFTGSSGTYYNTINKSYNGKMIVVYNNNSSYVLSSIPASYDNYELVFSANGYYLCEKALPYHQIDINYVDMENANNSYTLAYNLNQDTKNIKYVSFDNKLIIVENDDNFIIKIAKIENKNINIYQYYNVNYKCDQIKIYNNEIYLFSFMDNIVITKLVIYNYQFIDNYQLIDNCIDSIKYEDMKIYKNFQEVEIEEKSDFSNLNFGKYNKKNIKEKNNLKVIYNSKVEVPLKINVNNDENYDIGSILKFNAKAYLNNEAIESGFILNNIGKYQLDILSENDDKQTFYFNVVDKSEKEYVNMDFKNIAANKDYAYIQYEESKLSFSSNDYDVSLYENKENFYYIIFFVLFISFIISIYLIIKHKKRKKD